MPLVVVAGITAIGPALAETPSDDPSVRPAIIVMGDRLSVPIGTTAFGSVEIGRERLVNGAANRLENVLSDVAGFQQFRRSDSRSSNPSAQGATLRSLGGNAASRTLVLLDGIPMADPFFGSIPFNALVPERLSSVRVTRGAGSGAFGAGAVAGVIDLSSARRGELPLTSAGAFYGSREATELSATLSPELGAGFAMISGRWNRGDGFWTTPADQRAAASVPAAYRDWSVAVRGVAPLSDEAEIQASALVFRDDRVLRFRGADSHSEGQDASIRLIARGRWEMEALAYVQSRNFSNVVISATSFAKTLDQRDTPSTGLGGKVEIRPPMSSAHRLRLGADMRFATGDMFEEPYSAGRPTEFRHAGGDQTTAGFFIEDDWTLGPLVLTGSARADNWSIANGFYAVRQAGSGGSATRTDFSDRTNWEFSGRFGGHYRINDVVALRGAAYSGFRLPTLNELYRPFVVFPVRTQANAALQPERLRGAELGVELSPADGVDIGVTGFYNRLNNAIANVTIASNVRERQNVRAVVAQGVELTVAARSGNGRLWASYAFNDAEVRAPGQAFDGRVPAQTARHVASATGSWEPPTGPAFSVTMRYVGRQYEDDLEIDALPAALTFDGTARLPVSTRLELVARAENIADETIYTRNASGSLDLGTPRTLWIGVRLR